jgi:hypothetical protein
MRKKEKEKENSQGELSGSMIPRSVVQDEIWLKRQGSTPDDMCLDVALYV